MIEFFSSFSLLSGMLLVSIISPYFFVWVRSKIKTKKNSWILGFAIPAIVAIVLYWLPAVLDGKSHLERSVGALAFLIPWYLSGTVLNIILLIYFKYAEKNKSLSKYFEGIYFQYLVLIVIILLSTFLFGLKIKEKLTAKPIIFDYPNPDDHPNREEP